MPRQSYTWVITDTHWYHNEMITLCGRPPDFGERLLANLRYYLAPQDILIHLGDVIFYQYPRLKAMLDSVPGTKILTMGNHDKKSPTWYMRNGFAFATDAIILGDILLSHKPVEVLPSGVRLNVHGHWHNSGHRNAERQLWWTPERHRLLAPSTARCDFWTSADELHD